MIFEHWLLDMDSTQTGTDHDIAHGATRAMNTAHSSDMIESLHRRLRFSESTQYRFDSLLARLGFARHPLLRDVPLFGASIAFDVVEAFRTLGRFGHFGRARLDGLSRPHRLPQFPYYRGYWYDPNRHALVGMHLGLDLNYHDGKYYVIEINLGAAIKPARRALYQTPIDPFVTATLDIARVGKFERIVFFQKHWKPQYVEEFKIATRQSGIEVVGASPPTTDPNARHPMVGLPDPLQRNTIYVVFPNLATPLSHFVHNKEHSARWLAESIEAAGDSKDLLAYVPTFSELVIPPGPTDPAWPNLVVKLANKDRGRFVVMGRFRTKEEARAALGMRGDRDVPRVFKLGRFERAKNQVFPRLDPVFQQFIPPRIVDGRACKTRLHVFISPLADAYLSAHATTAGVPMPGRPEPGKVDTTGAYNVSYSVDGAYRAVSSEEEESLRRVAQEFGRAARKAITKKFETGPADD